jgi:hypothetical protein
MRRQMAVLMSVVDVGPDRWDIRHWTEAGLHAKARKKYSKAVLTRAENRHRFDGN